MDELLEKLLAVNESNVSRLISALRDVYQTILNGGTPESIDVDRALSMMKENFEQVIKPYEDDPTELEKDYFQSAEKMGQMLNGYKDRIKRIGAAINSDNIGDKIAELDGSVDQIHCDMKFIEQLFLTVNADVMNHAGSKKLYLALRDLVNILYALGKVAKPERDRVVKKSDEGYNTGASQDR